MTRLTWASAWAQSPMKTQACNQASSEQQKTSWSKAILMMLTQRSRRKQMRPLNSSLQARKRTSQSSQEQTVMRWPTHQPWALCRPMESILLLTRHCKHHPIVRNTSPRAPRRKRRREPLRQMPTLTHTRRWTDWCKHCSRLCTRLVSHHSRAHRQPM